MATRIALVDPVGPLVDRTLERIARFDGYHAGLVGVQDVPELAQAQQSLTEWQSQDHRLYVIEADGSDAGFVHVWFKGPIAAWIEDLWVDEDRRGRGIASAAILTVEQTVRATRPRIEALSMDVAPRNDAALRLYRRLGYDSLSLITLRKQLQGQDRRDKTTSFLGETLRY